MADAIPQPTPACFFCDQEVTWQEGRITDHGRIYGDCCADLVRARESVRLMRVRERAAVRAEART